MDGDGLVTCPRHEFRFSRNELDEMNTMALLAAENQIPPAEQGKLDPVPTTSYRVTAEDVEQW